MRPLRIIIALNVMVAACWAQPGFASDAAWQALQAGGTVALVRHARAPGTGDPPGFRLADCATQRNLSAEGREQARRMGEAFRMRQIPVERVLSSRWCRSLDTARLAFGELAAPYPSLDSFFSERDRQNPQTQAVRQTIENWRSAGVLVLVTHQVNITALTGVFPAEGEVLVLKPDEGGFDLVGRITLDENS
jgi:phosphohistidine phosphatase SixA